jgi:hypothetical protein
VIDAFLFAEFFDCLHFLTDLLWAMVLSGTVGEEYTFRDLARRVPG